MFRKVGNGMSSHSIEINCGRCSKDDLTAAPYHARGAGATNTFSCASIACHASATSAHSQTTKLSQSRFTLISLTCRVHILGSLLTLHAIVVTYYAYRSGIAEQKYNSAWLVSVRKLWSAYVEHLCLSCTWAKLWLQVLKPRCLRCTENVGSHV